MTDGALWAKVDGLNEGPFHPPLEVLMFPIKHLSRSDEIAAANQLGVPVSVIKAVKAVEARQRGFITGTDRPCILFEGHHFSRLTKGKYDRAHPDISYPKWTRVHYKGGRGEYDRLLKAIRINRGDSDPALKSASWGLFQIMGFNHDLVGYETVGAFVNAMALGEPQQLTAFVRFIEHNNLADKLRSERWDEFARAYNGPAYRANKYHIKLAAEFTKARAMIDEERTGGQVNLERGDTMQLQAALNVAIDTGLVVDGWIGDNTRAAIRTFQEREGMPVDGKVSKELLDRLELEVPDYDAIVEA
ncbi:N-acetylmuramidase domain-containing protein [Salipiger sp. PrR002]|uniref:N-acetylmuramidase domain-containing protein n=1 Tax=Salipiger sp. PrR002 TaxID=2706489 RepID=UPI0013BC1E2C|nr:N-acetylmuramidase domain-containing protein [Salipiger sp. PrR002]NDW00112.1 DUF3380 domain-containing protein [Salipiger sp. PrR002]NDW56879.1 DUF3380 domain-containing protein [Salipiger sp. PrR004]